MNKINDILSLCKSQVEISNVYIPDELRSGCIIRFMLNETVVEGSVSIGVKELSVSLISPLHGPTSTSKLMDLAPIIWTEEPIEGSVANEYGKSKAVAMLVDLYVEALKNITEK